MDLSDPTTNDCKEIKQIINGKPITITDIIRASLTKEQFEGWLMGEGLLELMGVEDENTISM